jgi:Skp family chaperone for outer membrane proteins
MHGRRPAGRRLPSWCARRRHGEGILALALASVLVLATGDPALAQDKLPAAVVAVIDFQRILREAKAARAIRDQVESRRQLYQEEIAGEEQRLHEADKELARQRGILSAEAFAERRSAFEADVAAVQRMVQERRRQLDQVAASSLNEVRSAMLEVVGELSDARGFNLVLPTSGLLLFSPKIDLTDEALARLDRKLPNIRVPERAE